MNRRHGFCGTSTYLAWQNLKRTHGGVCLRWQNFENFIVDMGPKPSDSYWLFRAKAYQRSRSGNVKWCVYKRQFRNIWQYLTPEEVLACHQHICVVCERGGYDFDAGMNEFFLQDLSRAKDPVARIHSWIKRYLPRILSQLKKKRGEVQFYDEVKYASIKNVLISTWA